MLTIIFSAQSVLQTWSICEFIKNVCKDLRQMASLFCLGWRQEGNAPVQGRDTNGIARVFGKDRHSLEWQSALSGLLSVCSVWSAIDGVGYTDGRLPKQQVIIRFRIWDNRFFYGKNCFRDLNRACSGHQKVKLLTQVWFQLVLNVRYIRTPQLARTDITPVMHWAIVSVNNRSSLECAFVHLFLTLYA